MIREPKPSPIEEVRSVEDAGRPPAGLPKPAQAFCSGCGAQLRSGARFCSDCGTAHDPAPEGEAAAIHSQFGGSSADLAELLSARGNVVPCPRCNELNNASASYCRHCGHLRPGAGASHPTAGHTIKRVLRCFEAEIAMTALLGATAMGLWLARSPTAPVIGAPQSTASLSVPTVQPTEPVASAAPVEPVAPSTASGARGEGQEEASPSVSPPGSAQKQAPTPERTHKKLAKTTVLRASAPIAIDQLYRHRAAERCADGLNGLICREKLRFELCNGKWTQEPQSGMAICRLHS